MLRAPNLVRQNLEIGPDPQQAITTNNPCAFIGCYVRCLIALYSRVSDPYSFDMDPDPALAF